MNALTNALGRVLVGLFLLLPISTDARTLYCQWFDHGCLHHIEIYDGPDTTAHHWVNCGGGWDYMGSGSFGGCPGEVWYW